MFCQNKQYQFGLFYFILYITKITERCKWWNDEMKRRITYKDFEALPSRSWDNSSLNKRIVRNKSRGRYNRAECWCQPLDVESSPCGPGRATPDPLLWWSAKRKFWWLWRNLALWSPIWRCNNWLQLADLQISLIRIRSFTLIVITIFLFNYSFLYLL